MKRIVEGLVQWIPEKMESIGARRAVLGISGGKDSTVMAGVLAKALGRENVYGLLMPADEKTDLSTGLEIANYLGINNEVLNIGPAIQSIEEGIEGTGLALSQQAHINLPPRIRMSLLYAYAQSLKDGAVVNTSNLSEDWIGYVTVYGDSAGAFSPFGMLTASEVIQLGIDLGLPENYVRIPPADGLREEDDEEVFGFSYKVLDHYIRTGEIEDLEIKEKIDRMHKLSRFKFQTIDLYNPGLRIGAKELGDFYKKQD